MPKDSGEHASNSHSPMSKSIIHSDAAPAAIGPYNQATAFNDIIFGSGQIAINPESGELVTDNIEAETRQVLENVGGVLAAANSSFDKVLKCSVFVKDMNMYSRINAVYAEFFTGDAAPARELVEVSELPKGVNIEISFIAHK